MSVRVSQSVLRTELLARVASLLGVAAIAALAMGQIAALRPQLAFAGWLLASAALGGAVGWCLGRRGVRAELLAREALERLVEAAEQDAAAVEAEAPLDLPTSNPWQGVLGRATAALADVHARLADAEGRRASLEIRARRFAGEAERMQSILDGLAEPVLWFNEFDELALSNAGARRLLALSDDPPRKHALTGEPALARFAEVVAEARRHKSTTHRAEECELIDPESGPRTFSVAAVALGAPGASGRGGVLIVLRDVTQQKVVQRRHAEFVSSVSHEMKTPLAGIAAYVEMLANGDAQDAATREEFLGVINTQAERLRRLVDKLLNLSRIEAGVVKVHKQHVSLNELLEEALHVVRPTAEQKRIALVPELSSMYVPVLADRDQMLQAAINLLSNAIKYTPPGGRVTLRSRLADGQTEFEVEDTGVGLAEEDQVRVFERFYRVAKDEHMAQGTGLGLPLAKHIVEDVHGGRLTLRSQLGVGSTFAVCLPRAGQVS